MATCKNCGKRFNKSKTAESILDRLWIFNEVDFGNLCLECAIKKFTEDMGAHPDDYYDRDEDEEFDEYDDGMGAYEMMSEYLGDD